MNRFFLLLAPRKVARFSSWGLILTAACLVISGLRLFMDFELEKASWSTFGLYWGALLTVIFILLMSAVRCLFDTAR